MVDLRTFSYDIKMAKNTRSCELSEDQIKSRWPLHWLVWRDDHVALKRLLREPEEAQVS